MIRDVDEEAQVDEAKPALGFVAQVKKDLASFQAFRRLFNLRPFIAKMRSKDTKLRKCWT